MTADSSPSRFAASLPWGVFCACSWTWCIGMYLPRIMIERFGWWGFIAFAIPNVIGCTAFGYVIKNRARSEAMVARHATAMLTFSAATVAFHLFFVVWLFDSIVALPRTDLLAPLSCVAIVFSLAGVFSFLPNRDWLGLGVIVYAISLLAFWNIGTDGLKVIAWTGAQPCVALVVLAPALLFGFLLCPYVDLTFHRAIQHAPGPIAFVMFGATFSVMIVLTCAIWFWPGFTDHWLPPMVIAHLVAQTVFTTGAHLRELRISPMIRTGTWRVVALFAPLGAAVLLYLGRMATDSPKLGEHIYMAFLALYASLFPAWFAWKALRRRK